MAFKLLLDIDTPKKRGLECCNLVRMTSTVVYVSPYLFLYFLVRFPEQFQLTGTAYRMWEQPEQFWKVMFRQMSTKEKSDPLYVKSPLLWVEPGKKLHKTRSKALQKLHYYLREQGWQPVWPNGIISVVTNDYFVGITAYLIGAKVFYITQRDFYKQKKYYLWNVIDEVEYIGE